MINEAMIATNRAVPNRLARSSSGSTPSKSARDGSGPLTGKATIAGVADFGLFIELDDTPNVQGLCHARTLRCDDPDEDLEWWERDWVERTCETEMGSKLSGRIWRLGHRIEAKLFAGDVARGHVDAIITRKLRSRRRRDDG